MRKSLLAFVAGMSLVSGLLFGAASSCGTSPTDGGREDRPSSTMTSSVLPGSAANTTPTALDFSYSSREGRPVEVIVFGSGASATLILGGIHGDEPDGVRLARAIARRFTEKPSLVSGSNVVIVPCVNPDGLKYGTRKNAAGIDINRNFPTSDFDRSGGAGGREGRYYGGTIPGSEPETRLILDLVDRLSPRLVIALHAPLACINFDGPGEEVAGVLAEVTALPLSPDIGYETPGSLGTYVGDERGLAVVTVELGQGHNDFERLADAIASVVQGR